jgi:L-fuconolactonase
MTPVIDRRSVLASGAALMLPGRALAAGAMPIIDCHIHLFDPNRPQGAPYAGPPTSPTHASGAFPATYAKAVAGLGVMGAVQVEASPWVEDNLWVLEQCGAADLMVGSVGNLRPEAADFGPVLERFAKNPLFRGIRYGNLWGYDLVAQVANPVFLDGLRRLSSMDLLLETANPRLDLIEAVLKAHDAVPSLRIVLDHIPGFEPKQDAQRFKALIAEFKGRDTVFC